MRRIIVTGANGAGKTDFVGRLSISVPQLPVFHFDSLKLTRDWVQRDRSDIEARLRSVIATPTWILEGGPSFLAEAMPRADVLVWLDPPTPVRAWRLAKRPWTSLGRTRPELPDGNPDRLWQQYGFALGSLAKSRSFHDAVAAYAAAPAAQVLHCRSRRDTEAALAILAAGASS